MKRYRVKVYRIREEDGTIDVDASSMDVAQRKAEKIAQNGDVLWSKIDERIDAGETEIVRLDEVRA